MMKKDILLSDLVIKLDTLFSIPAWESDPGKRFWSTSVYGKGDYDYARVFEADFLSRFNGLMLRSSKRVQEVFCAAFPSPEIVEQVLETTVGDSLLFLHHPVDMEVSGVGFLPIPGEALDQFKSRGVSIYACHAPMDCHDQVSTNASIVEAFGMEVQASFARYGIGYAGRVGKINPTTLADLTECGRHIFGVKRVEVGGADPGLITTCAVVAGGGDDVELFEEAETLGAQVYITGEWFTRTTPPDQDGKAWAETNRVECLSYARSSSMAFLGFSHAATEYLVMPAQMAGIFEREGLKVRCLQQSDWWR